MHFSITNATITNEAILLHKGVRKISNLAQVRKARGLSQRALAEKAGVSRVTIARIETDKISPTLRTFEQLAAALDVPVSELIERAG